MERDPLEYVLNRMEFASGMSNPAQHGYGLSRKELLDGIAALRADLAAALAQLAEKEGEIKRLREAVEWACSEDAAKQSMRLPRGCSPMNGPERMTADICIENLQIALRRRAGGEE